jgi:hypothetical protein
MAPDDEDLDSSNRRWRDRSVLSRARVGAVVIAIVGAIGSGGTALWFGMQGRWTNTPRSSRVDTYIGELGGVANLGQRLSSEDETTRLAALVSVSQRSMSLTGEQAEEIVSVVAQGGPLSEGDLQLLSRIVERRSQLFRPILMRHLDSAVANPEGLEHLAILARASGVPPEE